MPLLLFVFSAIFENGVKRLANEIFKGMQFPVKSIMQFTDHFHYYFSAKLIVLKTITSYQIFRLTP
jgi:hypothetical protein